VKCRHLAERFQLPSYVDSLKTISTDMRLESLTDFTDENQKLLLGNTNDSNTVSFRLGAQNIGNQISGT
jgi:hypothetical protein